MNEKYACFISYRHPGDPEAQKYIQRFEKMLKKHLCGYLPGALVFLDETGLRNGIIDKKLANALCHSACFVIFFSRHHFDLSHPYCAREYHAMVKLETARLSVIPDLEKDGLIFTVARRDFDRIPDEIRSKRICHDFGEVDVESDFEEKPCQKKIDELAKAIANRYEKLVNGNAFNLNECDGFELCETAEIRDWLIEVAPLKTQVMPGF